MTQPFVEGVTYPDGSVEIYTDDMQCKITPLKKDDKVSADIIRACEEALAMTNEIMKPKETK